MNEIRRLYDRIVLAPPGCDNDSPPRGRMAQRSPAISSMTDCP